MLNHPGLSRRDFLRVGSASLAATALGGIPLTAAAAPQKPHPLTSHHEPGLLYAWVEKVYDLVRQERFSPTSAARAYGAIAVSAYESVVAGMPAHRGLGGQLNGLTPAPLPRTGARIHWPLALNAAVGLVALEVFADRSPASRASIREFATEMASQHGVRVRGDVLAASIDHGSKVGTHIASWIHSDGYPEILGLPYLPPVGPGLWERTPPNLGVAIEPHWERVRPMAIPTADFCAPTPPITYSAEAGSDFWNQAMVVYETSQRLTDEIRSIALFWRDNPDGTTGLPSGHWMQITRIAASASGADLAGVAEALALVGISLADAFTSCWTEKYRRNLLRPVTYIRNHIDPNWASFVNSPAFPEYTSGHSVGSGAAASTLTHLFGNLRFVDDSGVPYGRPAFTFASFWDAADEAATSRLFGGIHYPMAIDAGLDQGRHVSEVVLSRVRTRRWNA